MSEACGSADTMDGQLALSLATLNILADCYSHSWSHGVVDLQWDRRKDRLRAVLRRCAADILCLQEVDHYEDFFDPVLQDLGYEARYLQRPTRSDGCVLAWKATTYECLHMLEMDLDKVSSNQSWRKHNIALACLLKHNVSGRTFIVCTTHLYWNPRRPELKFAQARWVADSLFAWEHGRAGAVPIVLAGDFNALPDSDVYALLTGKTTPLHDVGKTAQYAARDKRFLCDTSLNRLCRWLRVCGIDTALETEEEGRARTEQKVFMLFERCTQEGRILLTSSKQIAQRRECPQCYLIDPKELETSFRTLCQQANIRLEKGKFLTVCVKCNGDIVESSYEEATASGVRVPEDVEIFLCSSCHQPYWWSERENSSAVRAKHLADHLYSLAASADTSTVDTEIPDSDEKHAVDSNDGAELDSGKNGETEELTAEVAPLNEQAEVQQIAPRSSFRSAFEQATGTEPPYTNWTSTFLGTLDYIFLSEQWRCTSAHMAPGAALIPTGGVDAVIDEVAEDVLRLELATVDAVHETPAVVKHSCDDADNHADRDVVASFEQSIAGPFPSSHWPSDHMMLVAALVLGEPSISS